MTKAKTDKQVNRIPLFDSKGKKADTLELNKEIFDGKFSKPLLYQALTMYRANQRRGTAGTKTRGNVRGGGKKPWRQKGTGRARTSSIRNPIWRGGGTIFGPHPRDYSYGLPKKLKEKALLASLNAKLRSGDIVALADITLAEPKTKTVAGILKKMNIAGSVLMLVEKADENLRLASRNIKGLTLKEVDEATALNIISSKGVVITKPAVEALNRKAKE
jgi:large subunit ribosomal protein L4